MGQTVQQPVIDPMDPTRVTRSAMVLFFLVGLFMVSLVFAALTAIKIHEFDLGLFTVLVPAGTMAFGLTYIATDVITEVWGRGWALCVVYSGLIMRLVMMFLIFYAMHLEDAADFITVSSSWPPERQAEFVSVFGSSNRTNFAGMVAFGLTAVSDVLIFQWLRQRHQGKNLLWLRNNVSTMVSQALNSTIFITVAFAGIVPWDQIALLIAGQVVIKLMIAAIDTPLVYLLRNIAQGRSLFDVRG
ncbi:queuosine precursor transporter [Maricaulis sp. CAU 1757]